MLLHHHWEVGWVHRTGTIDRNCKIQYYSRAFVNKAYFGGNGSQMCSAHIGSMRLNNNETKPSASISPKSFRFIIISQWLDLRMALAMVLSPFLWQCTHNARFKAFFPSTVSHIFIEPSHVASPVWSTFFFLLSFVSCSFPCHCKAKRFQFVCTKCIEQPHRTREYS